MAAVDALHAPGCAVRSPDPGPIGQWADTRTAELTQWATELRCLDRESPAVERIPTGGRPSPDVGLGPAVIVPMVEIMLRGAMERLDAEAAAARAESDALVATAMQDATALILSVGDDLRALQRASLSRLVTRPPAPQIGHPSTAPAAWPELDLLSESGLPEPGAEVFGPEIDVRDAAQVYDLFWSEVLAERPVVERFRRWVQRPQP